MVLSDCEYAGNLEDVSWQLGGSIWNRLPVGVTNTDFCGSFLFCFCFYKSRKEQHNNMEIILRTHIMKAVHFRFVWKYSVMVESWIWWHSLLYFMFDCISINFVICPFSMCAHSSCQRLFVLTYYILVTTRGFTDDIFLP